MSDPVIICQVCDNALDHYADQDGVGYIHAMAAGPTLHEPVPVQAPPGWRGRCDFCTGQSAEFVVPAADFRVPAFPGVAGLPEAHSKGDWAACGMCVLLVDTNRWNALVGRAAAHHHTKYGEPLSDDVRAHLRRIYHLLRLSITGAPRRIEETT